MAKPKRYPRKLRQTLERVANARDERQVEEPKPRPMPKAEYADDIPDEYRTFYHCGFFRNGSVQTILGRPDFTSRSLVTEYEIHPLLRPRYILVPPPFDPINTDDDAS
jgi:hypothetical protein